MAKFDVETLLNKTAAVVKDNLNAEIVCINTEKADFDLAQFTDSMYYFQNLTNEVFSYKQFIMWGMYDNPQIIDTTQVASLKKVEVFFEVVLVDDAGPMSENVFIRLLRYSRALEQVIQKKGGTIRSGTKFKVSSLNPTSLSFAGKTLRSAGITIEAAI